MHHIWYKIINGNNNYCIVFYSLRTRSIVFDTLGKIGEQIVTEYIMKNFNHKYVPWLFFTQPMYIWI